MDIWKPEDLPSDSEIDMLVESLGEEVVDTIVLEDPAPKTGCKQCGGKTIPGKDFCKSKCEVAFAMSSLPLRYPNAST